MEFRKMFYLVLILSVVFSVGCSSRRSDDQIQKDIQTKAAADPDTKDSNFTVSSKDGKVTLSGNVKDKAASQKLETIAKEEPGVSDVEDEISVEPTPAPAPQSATTAATEKQTPPPPIVVPAGTILTVRLNQALSSKSSKTGQTFLATLAQPISVGGRPAFVEGSSVSGTVVNAKAKGKFKGEGELTLALTSISVKGHTYQIQTQAVTGTEKGKGKRTAATTGGGAAGGALIGGLAGGGKGAAIGAAVGAGAGLLGGAATGNKQVEYPAEAALSFTMNQPLTLQQ